MADLKRHLPLPDQVSLLKSRGLDIACDDIVESTLFNINYYRLSGYLHDFKKPNSDSYIDSLSWRRLKRIYDFDRKMTRILMYILEDIEETLKTRLSYILTSCFPDDPLIYLNRSIYRSYYEYNQFRKYFSKEKANNNGLPFVKHHNQKYGGQLPMWVAVELLTMGNLHAVYDNLLGVYQKRLAKAYFTGPRQLSNWIKNLTFTRNHLAHYMRIYNFNFGRTPVSCQNHPKVFSPTNMIFDQIFVMFCMYSDELEWQRYVLPELKRLITDYAEDIELSGIGFPEDWVSILSYN